MVLDKRWTDTIDRALADRAWDAYDLTLQSEIAEYNQRFAFSLAWKTFKALIWTESGAASPAWNTRPMQIGNAGDPAWNVVRNKRENSSIIMSDAFANSLAKPSLDNPQFNIKAGLVYALTKLSVFGTQIIDATRRSHIVASGENLTVIAQNVGTTIENLKALNPASAGTLRVGQTLTYQTARIWPLSCPVTTALLQSRYNGNGDFNYAAKLDYCLATIAKLKR
jgi:LysM repeat protein